MTDLSTKQPVTAKKRTAGEDKAQTTNSAAWQIIDSERAARERKSAKLRELRLQQEPVVSEEAPVKAKKARVSKR